MIPTENKNVQPKQTSTNKTIILQSRTNFRRSSFILIISLIIPSEGEHFVASICAMALLAYSNIRSRSYTIS